MWEFVMKTAKAFMAAAATIVFPTVADGLMAAWEKVAFDIPAGMETTVHGAAVAAAAWIAVWATKNAVA